MVIVLASISVKAGKTDEFLKAFNANVPAVLKEDGCIEYMPTMDVDSGIPVQISDANIVTICEKWESLDHLKVHLTAPHMLAYREKVADIVEGTTLKVLSPA